MGVRIPEAEAASAPPARQVQNGHVRFEPGVLEEEQRNTADDSLQLNFGLLLQGCTYVSRLPLDGVPEASVTTGARSTKVLPQCEIAACVMDGAVEVVVHAKEDGSVGKFSASLNVLGEGQEVELRGTILRSGQGTPSLKSGVRCIGKRTPTAHTDSSDWAGF